MLRAVLVTVREGRSTGMVKGWAGELTALPQEMVAVAEAESTGFWPARVSLEARPISMLIWLVPETPTGTS